MIWRLALLIGGCLAFWLLVALPSRRIWGDGEAVCSGLAALLCLVPAGLTLLWAGWALERSPDQQLVMLLGATGVRMFVVLAGALALYKLIPYLQEQPGYWIWILVFYLFTLVLEMALLLGGRPAEKSR